MTFWPLTNSDFPTDQTFHQCHDLYTELDLHRIMSGFHGAFATGVASQQGTLTLPDTWFRPPFWDLLMLQLLRPNSSNLPCLYSTFHLEYPLVLSFAILLLIYRSHQIWSLEVNIDNVLLWFFFMLPFGTGGIFATCLFQARTRYFTERQRANHTCYYLELLFNWSIISS